MTIISSNGLHSDFLVNYSWIEQPQKLFQHMRSNFIYKNETLDHVYMIFPEFLSEKGDTLEPYEEVLLKGKARMQIACDEMRETVHRSKIKVGVEGYLIAAGTRIAEVEVIGILKGLL